MLERKGQKENTLTEFATKSIGSLSHTGNMFSERLAKGKTRMIVDISDSNLLRLRVLQLYEQRECSFSEYLDEFLDGAIKRYIDAIFENGISLYDPKASLLNELLPEKTDFCNYPGISVEIDAEEAGPLVQVLEEIEMNREMKRYEEGRRKKTSPLFFTHYGHHREGSVDYEDPRTGLLGDYILATDRKWAESFRERTEDAMKGEGKKTCKSKKN